MIGTILDVSSRESGIRIIGALLMEQDKKWVSGRKYIDMTEYFEWQKEISKKSKDNVI